MFVFNYSLHLFEDYATRLAPILLDSCVVQAVRSNTFGLKLVLRINTMASVVVDRVAYAIRKLYSRRGVASRGAVCCAGYTATTHATNGVAATLLTLGVATLRRTAVSDHNKNFR